MLIQLKRRYCDEKSVLRRGGARRENTVSQRIMELRYYIAFGAPATRTLADGNEAFLRPEIGFSPSWFHRRCGIDFSRVWHEDPKVRFQAHTQMRAAMRRWFPGVPIGDAQSDGPPDPVEFARWLASDLVERAGAA